MRRYLFLLLIALLPLRGWAASAQAMDMAINLAVSSSGHAAVASALAATTAALQGAQAISSSHARGHERGPTHDRSHATGADHHHAANTADEALSVALAHPPQSDTRHCHDAPAGDMPASTGHDGGCGNCQACQACHTVGLTPESALLPALPLASATLPRAGAVFASATAALAQKPPIA